MMHDEIIVNGTQYLIFKPSYDLYGKIVINIFIKTSKIKPEFDVATSFIENNKIVYRPYNDMIPIEVKKICEKYFAMKVFW